MENRPENGNNSFPDTNPNPVLELDLACEITYFNKAASFYAAEPGAAGIQNRLIPSDIHDIIHLISEKNEKQFTREVVFSDKKFIVRMHYEESTKKIRIYAEDITERKLTYGHIRKQNEFVDKVINSLQYPLYVIDTNYQIIFSNDAAKARGIVDGGRCYQLTHHRQEPCDREHVCPLKEVIRTGKPMVAEHIHFDNLGNKHNIEVHGDPVFNKDGQVIQMIEYSIDISERKKAEAELISEQNKLEFSNVILRTQQETSLDGILVVDSKGDILSFNQHFLEIWGVPPGLMASKSDEQVLGSVLNKLQYPEEFLSKVKHLYGHQNEISKDEIDLKDGRLLDRYSAPMFGSEGKYYGRVWYFRDITEQKKMAEALVDSFNFLRVLIESMPVPVFSKDMQGRYTQANKAFYEDVYGLTKDQLIGKTVYDIAPPELAALYEAKDKDLFQHPGMQAYEAQVKYADGKPHQVKFYKATYNDSKGAVAGLVGVILDISELLESKQALRDAYLNLKDAQEQLIQSEKLSAIGQLVAGISHELNQPLTGIRGFAQIMLMESAHDTSFREDLRKIMEQADRMDKIIKSIKFFARKSDFEWKPVEIRDAINDSCNLIQQQLKLQNIHIIKNYAPDLPLILGDANQFQQVFVNLLTNARDAIAAKKESTDFKNGSIAITVSTDDDKKRIIITVRDNGTGISENNLPDIFNPFYTTKSPDGGMGLGLSIVYRVIANHNGNISVQSPPEGGAIFTINLPAAQKAEAVQ